MPTLEDFKKTELYTKRMPSIKSLIERFPLCSKVKVISTDQELYVRDWSDDGRVLGILPCESNLILINEHNYKKLKGCEAHYIGGLFPENLELIQENPELFFDDGSHYP